MDILCTLLVFLIIATVAYQLYYHYIIWKPCKPEFNGKVVLITGATSGLGESMALKFAQ